VHDGTIGFDGSTDDIVAILQVNDNDLRRSRGFVGLTDADEAI